MDNHPMEGCRIDPAQAEILRLRAENNDLRICTEQLIAACCRTPLQDLPIVKASAELVKKINMEGSKNAKV